MSEERQSGHLDAPERPSLRAEPPRKGKAYVPPVPAESENQPTNGQRAGQVPGHAQHNLKDQLAQGSAWATATGHPDVDMATGDEFGERGSAAGNQRRHPTADQPARTTIAGSRVVVRRAGLATTTRIARTIPTARPPAGTPAVSHPPCGSRPSAHWWSRALKGTCRLGLGVSAWLVSSAQRWYSSGETSNQLRSRSAGSSARSELPRTESKTSPRRSRGARSVSVGTNFPRISDTTCAMLLAPGKQPAGEFCAYFTDQLSHLSFQCEISSQNVLCISDLPAQSKYWSYQILKGLSSAGFRRRPWPITAFQVLQPNLSQVNRSASVPFNEAGPRTRALWRLSQVTLVGTAYPAIQDQFLISIGQGEKTPWVVLDPANGVDFQPVVEGFRCQATQDWFVPYGRDLLYGPLWHPFLLQVCSGCQIYRFNHPIPKRRVYC